MHPYKYHTLMKKVYHINLQAASLALLLPSPLPWYLVKTFIESLDCSSFSNTLEGLLLAPEDDLFLLPDMHPNDDNNPPLRPLPPFFPSDVQAPIK